VAEIDRLPLLRSSRINFVGVDKPTAISLLLDVVRSQNLGAPAQRPVAEVDRSPTRFPGAFAVGLECPPRPRGFVNRDELLRRLHEQLRKGPVALVGLGGIGKTATAIEYAHRRMADYDSVWFVDAGSEASVRSGLAQLGPAFGPSGDRGWGRGALARFSLATLNGDEVLVHRLVGAVVRDGMTPERRSESGVLAEQLLADSAPGGPQLPEHWRAYARLVPHLEAIEGCTLPEYRRLVLDAAWFHLFRGGRPCRTRTQPVGGRAVPKTALGGRRRNARRAACRGCGCRAVGRHRCRRAAE
jgi:hypothetical protein